MVILALAGESSQCGTFNVAGPWLPMWMKEVVHGADV